MFLFTLLLVVFVSRFSYGIIGTHDAHERMKKWRKNQVQKFNTGTRVKQHGRVELCPEMQVFIQKQTINTATRVKQHGRVELWSESGFLNQKQKINTATRVKQHGRVDCCAENFDFFYLSSKGAREGYFWKGTWTGIRGE